MTRIITEYPDTTGNKKSKIFLSRKKGTNELLFKNKNINISIKDSDMRTGLDIAGSDIAHELEKEGHKTKTGKTTWNPKTVSVIIKRAVNE